MQNDVKVPNLSEEQLREMNRRLKECDEDKGEPVSVEIVDGFFDYFVGNQPWYEKLYYRLYRLIGDTKYKLKCLKQKFQYGFPLYESWNLNTYVAKYTLPRLKHFRNNLSGHPLDLTQYGWEEVLDKMIWSFENFDKDPRPVYPENYDHRMLKKTYASGNCVFTSMDDRRVNYDNVYEHKRKVQEGLDLFGKYFVNLWD